MSKSCDLLLNNKHQVHLSVIPKIGLIIVNDLKDFGENWLEVKVVQNSRYQLQYDIKTMSGIQTNDSELHAAARYFVDIMHNCLHKKAGPMPEQVGSLLKFILNINLNMDILSDRKLIMSLGLALRDLLRQGTS